MPMLTCVEFRSGRFPAYEGEGEEVNSGRWGKRLAEFLRDGLHREGFAAGEPFREDWGWMLKIANPRFGLSIACGNYDEYQDGYLCVLNPHQPFLRRRWRFWERIDTRERVEALQRAVNKILSEADGIRDISWWTNEQWMNPPTDSGEVQPDSGTGG
jgi:hypothetical protein